MEKTENIKKSTKVWILNGEVPQQETVINFADDIQEYELSDGNFYERSELFLTKKELLLKN